MIYKKKNKELKKKNINESDFINWDHEQILLWILSLNNGYFNKYSDTLNKQLKECDITGNDLYELNTTDIRGLGIKKFSDAKKLEKYIQELIHKYGSYNTNNHNHNNHDDEGNIVPVAYL